MAMSEVELVLVTYDEDFFLWTQQQAELLRRRNDDGPDWENLAEEIESLGGRDRRELDSRLRGLLLHLLKWYYQPDERKGGWQASIRFQRYGIEDILKQSPSLRRRPKEVLGEIYPKAREAAFEEMRLVSIGQIPPECPFTLEEIFDPEWLPTYETVRRPGH